MNNNQKVMSPQQNFILAFNRFCNIEKDWLKRKSNDNMLKDEDRTRINQLRNLPCVTCVNANKKNVFVGEYWISSNSKANYYIPTIFCKIVFAYIISTDDEHFDVFTECSDFIEESVE